MRPVNSLNLNTSVNQNISESLTGCFHEGFVQLEGEQWLWKVSEEVFEDTRNDIDVFYFVKWRQSLSSNQLLLQLFHHAFLARNSVQANLGQGKDQRNQLSWSGCLSYHATE